MRMPRPLMPLLALLLAAAPAFAANSLTPAKQWYAPDQPLTVKVTAGRSVRLVMTDFVGRLVEAEQGMAGGKPELTLAAGASVDLKVNYPAVRREGTFLLYAEPADAPRGQSFLGTPLVIEVAADPRPAAPPGPMVFRIVPLQFAEVSTGKGPMTMAFYYDVAPVTVDAVIRLAEGGFYDGLIFHRVVKGTIIQTGDPRGEGTGGPGFHLGAEFSDRRVDRGAVAMSRLTDPIEKQGAMPRAEAADSAGSQFFIALRRLEQLDRRYTVFGRITDGLAAADAIGSVPVPDESLARPKDPPALESIKIVDVTFKRNPYLRIFAPTSVANPSDVLEGSSSTRPEIPDFQRTGKNPDDSPRETAPPTGVPINGRTPVAPGSGGDPETQKDQRIVPQ